MGNRVATTLAGKRLLIESDDESIFPILFVGFGGDDGRNDVPFFHASLNNHLLHVRRGGAVTAPSELFFGLDDETCPYVLNGSTISFRDDGSEQFTLDGDSIIVHKGARWREAVGSLLLRAFHRFIDDVIFVHASAIGVNGKGLLFIGFENAGKSTLALALAARSHDFLSDEYGCYEPSTHELIPYRRPVGIREGRRAAAIDRAIAHGNFRRVEYDNTLRVDLGTLIPLPAERRLPLHCIVFIDGFADDPSLRFVDAAAHQVGMLQTLYSSLSNAPRGRRTFELARMLSRSRVAFLKIGDPDETAAMIEKEFGS